MKRIYLFGIVYAIGSLGCVFPIFLSIVVQGIAYKSILDGVYTIFAYALGMSLVMIAITTLTFATKYLILKRNEKDNINNNFYNKQFFPLQNISGCIFHQFLISYLQVSLPDFQAYH